MPYRLEGIRAPGLARSTVIVPADGCGAACPAAISASVTARSESRDLGVMDMACVRAYINASRAAALESPNVAPRPSRPDPVHPGRRWRIGSRAARIGGAGA